MTTLSVSKRERRERQGIGKPLLRSNLSASAVFSAFCCKSLQHSFRRHSSRIALCQATFQTLELLGECGQGQEKHLRGEDLRDEKKTDTRSSGERAFQAERTAYAKALRRNEPGLLEEQTEGHQAGAERTGGWM